MVYSGAFQTLNRILRFGKRLQLREDLRGRCLRDDTTSQEEQLGSPSLALYLNENLQRFILGRNGIKELPLLKVN